MERSIELRVKPLWEEIEPTRNRIAEFAATATLSRDKVHNVVMIVSELLENAIKYGCFQPSLPEVAVMVHVNGTTITVEVANPIDESALPHLQALDQMIQWIRGYQDPFEAYVHRLKEVARRSVEDDASGLGLVRVAYEGQAILDFFVGDDGLVNVSAVASL